MAAVQLLSRQNGFTSGKSWDSAASLSPCRRAGNLFLRRPKATNWQLQLTLGATHQAFDPKRQMRLLNDFPEHRRAPARIAHLQPVAAGEEIVGGGAVTVGIPDRERMRNRPRASSPFVIGEPALVRVNAIGKPKIVQIADQAGAGGRSEKLNDAIGDMALDQLMMEDLEERPTERVRLATALPGGDVQFL